MNDSGSTPGTHCKTHAQQLLALQRSVSEQRDTEGCLVKPKSNVCVPGALVCQEHACTQASLSTPSPK